MRNTKAKVAETGGYKGGNGPWEHRGESFGEEIRRRLHLAGKLMAGWKPLAHKAGTRLPAAVEKQTGKGSAKIRHSMLHKATLEGRNSGHYPGLQGLVNRQVPWILKRNRSIAKRRAKALGKKLR